jgi:xanthine dehydrogenase iron-sulfur cluster and FAD-binding subunit A
MWHEYITVTSVEETLNLLSERGDKARIVAGATDLMLEIERGIRTGIDTLIDVSRIPGLEEITLDEDGVIHLGPLVTHNHCVGSKLIRERALPLAQAAWEVGSPQIRNRGTIAGNLVTASPANDTITPLMALGTLVTLRSRTQERIVPLARFYEGVRKTVMQPDEMLVDISFPAMDVNSAGVFIKLALRQAQAISLVNVAVVLNFTEHDASINGNGVVEKAAITLGAVAPVIIHAREAEDFLVGHRLDEGILEQAAKLAESAATPIDDLRSSADYRREMVRICTLRALREIASGEISRRIPDHPVLLRGKPVKSNGDGRPGKSLQSGSASVIHTTINERDYTFENSSHKSLLHLLREDAGLIGTKEGCAEGECGACTVFLDGIAVMSCLVPAARADGANIVTIEGVAVDGKLHPVQQSFIDEGAVQCGYCTPGFIMSGVKLLEERPEPTLEEIRHSITGNLCRCTGYYKIISAIESASHMEIADDKIRSNLPTQKP